MTTSRISRLENGLRVVTDVMAHLESVSVGVWVDAGARYEGAEVNGISHLLEHMLFKGTERRSARAIAEEIENVGGHLNAYTSHDATTFYAKVLAEHLPLAVDLLADLVQHPRLDATELAREREVILQEIGQIEDTPDDIVFDRLQAVAWPDQPLGRSILGTAESVRRLGPEDMRRHLATHYRASNMVVAAAGKVEHEPFLRIVEDAFGSLPDGPAPECARAVWRGGERRENRPTEQLHLAIGFPGVAWDDPDYYALQVLSTMLGGGMSSRLFQEVRETRGLAYSVYSFANSHADAGLFGIYAGTSAEAAKPLAHLVADEVRKMTEVAGEGEVARARAQLKAGLLMSLESTSSRIEQLGRQMLVFGRLIDSREMVERLEAVDAPAVARVCERILTDGPAALAAIGPQGDLPAYDSVAALFR